MRLINYTLLYLSVALFFIIGTWAAIFYINMIDEVYDSIDDGLENYKTLIIQKVKEDSSLLSKNEFGESNYAIKEMPFSQVSKMKDIYKDTLIYMHNEEDYEPVRLLATFFSTGNNRYYELRIISSMVEEDDLIEDLFYSVLWLYIIIIVSVLLVNHIVLKKAWKPFYQLIDYMQSFQLEKGANEISLNTKVEEFKLLNKSISALLERNVEVYNSQKQFIENAAHELQTPLAISINKLELLAEHSEMSEKQSQTISDIMESLSRLTRLNKTLLLLSKIENKQFEKEEEFSFNEIVKKAINDFSDLATFKSIELDYSEEGVLLKKMNKDLAEILIINLLKNAIVHNIEGGIVKLTLTKNSFTVENTGKNHPLNSEVIFTRFYKNTSEKSSTGLGLSIVKAIVDLYKGKISYHFSNRHIITISFQ